MQRFAGDFWWLHYLTCSYLVSHARQFVWGKTIWSLLHKFRDHFQNVGRANQIIGGGDGGPFMGHCLQDKIEIL